MRIEGQKAGFGSQVSTNFDSLYMLIPKIHEMCFSLCNRDIRNNLFADVLFRNGGIL